MTYIALFLPRLYIILLKPERNTIQLQCSGPANATFLFTKTVDRACNTSFHDVLIETGKGDDVLSMSPCDGLVSSPLVSRDRQNGEIREENNFDSSEM